MGGKEEKKQLKMEGVEARAYKSYGALPPGKLYDIIKPRQKKENQGGRRNVNGSLTLELTRGKGKQI